MSAQIEQLQAQPARPQQRSSSRCAATTPRCAARTSSSRATCPSVQRKQNRPAVKVSTTGCASSSRSRSAVDGKDLRRRPRREEACTTTRSPSCCARATFDQAATNALQRPDPQALPRAAAINESALVLARQRPVRPRASTRNAIGSSFAGSWSAAAPDNAQGAGGLAGDRQLPGRTEGHQGVPASTIDDLVKTYPRVRSGAGGASDRLASLK